MKSPLILIPGIQGTTLTNTNKKDHDKIWSGIRKLFDNLYDLLLNSDGITDSKEGVIIEHADVEDLAYSEIINFINNRTEYSAYIFGYDWRKSNIESARELEKFVNHLKKKCEVDSVSFVTHSMGCLVLSAYLKMLPGSDTIDKTIDKVIFTVPPFLGSAEAIFNLIIGKSRLFNSSDDFRKIARTFPSLFELCPVYDGAIIPSDNSVFDIYDYSQWQQNPNHDDYTEIKELFEARLKSLKSVRDHDRQLIFDLSSLLESTKKRMVILAGVGQKTQEHIGVSIGPNGKVNNQFIFNDKGENEFGDGTVHINSAGIFKDQILTLQVQHKWIETRIDSHFILHDWHSFFLNNGRVQNIIKRFLAKDQQNLKDEWYTSIDGGVSVV